MLLGVELEDARHDPGSGAPVVRVHPDGTCARAGIEPGDRLYAVGGIAIASMDDARDATRRIASLDRIAIEHARDGEPMSTEVDLARWPVEAYDGADVELGEVGAPGARVRTITTRPRGVRRPPCVILLQGLARTSIDLPLHPDAPFARMVRGLSAAGFATLRVEKLAVGDSEGRPEDADFEGELAMLRAAYDATVASVDGVIAFGHSVGGMALPLLRRELIGAIVFGTSARRWSECLRAGAERQLRLRGATREAIDATLGELARELPLHGTTRAYVEQLERAEIAHAWRAFEAPLLALHGEHDWVVGEDEMRELTTLVADATFERIAGVDHALGAHTSLADSLARYGRGEPDERVLEAALRWIHGRR